jgi:hypothetical protein
VLLRELANSDVLTLCCCCFLPPPLPPLAGSPATKYPWTWFWLIVPNVDRSKEIGMVFGTAKFQLVRCL